MLLDDACSLLEQYLMVTNTGNSTDRRTDRQTDRRTDWLTDWLTKTDRYLYISPIYTFINLSVINRPYSYSRYWTGTSLRWRLMRGNIIKKHLRRLPALASVASWFQSNTGIRIWSTHVGFLRQFNSNVCSLIKGIANSYCALFRNYENEFQILNLLLGIP